jgi:hypothetical protein
MSATHNSFGRSALTGRLYGRSAPKDKRMILRSVMKSNVESSTQEVLAGLVERVTFHNAGSGRRRAGTAIW